MVLQLFFRGFPLWAAYTIAYSLVDVYANELNTAEVPFDENDYSTIDATVWCREVIHYLHMYLNNLLNNSVPLPSNSFIMITICFVCMGLFSPSIRVVKDELFEGY